MSSDTCAFFLNQTIPNLVHNHLTFTLPLNVSKFIHHLMGFWASLAPSSPNVPCFWVPWFWPSQSVLANHLSCKDSQNWFLTLMSITSVCYNVGSRSWWSLGGHDFRHTVKKR